MLIDDLSQTNAEGVCPQVSILIVTYNSAAFIADCLRSILGCCKSTRYEIIVVDNASTDGSAELVRKNFPNVTLIACENNLGFAKANNLGAQRARGSFLLLLNPDTLLINDAVSVLHDLLRTNPKLGAAGAKMYHPDGTPWRYETWRITGITYLLHPFMLLLWGAPKSTEVSWLCGACIMTSTDLFRGVGGLDIPMYGEDMDYCWRLARKGYKILHSADAKIVHHWGGSLDNSTVRAGRFVVSRQSRYIYIRKNFGAWSANGFRAALSAEALVRSAYCAIASRCCPQNRRDIYAAKARAFLYLLQNVWKPSFNVSIERWWELR